MSNPIARIKLGQERREDEQKTVLDAYDKTYMKCILPFLFEVAMLCPNTISVKKIRDILNDNDRQFLEG